MSTKEWIKSRMHSFESAFKGIALIVKHERNMRIHMLISLLVVIFGFLLKISQTEWLFIIMAIAFVLVAESINSAIEKMSDAITRQNNSAIKRAKDIAAGAVLLAAISSAIIGLIIFIPYLKTAINSYAA